MKGILSTNDIALLQNVNRSRFRQIWCHYKNAKTVPILGKPGRPSRITTNEEISAVIGTYKEYPCSDRTNKGEKSGSNMKESTARVCGTLIGTR